MQPYNVKCITYPDLTKQYRVYSQTVAYRGRGNPVHRKKLEYDISPFDGKKCRVIQEDLDDYFDRVMDVSVTRTRKMVYDYARCNSWDWFVTFTFSPKLVDRYDYDACTSKMSKWLNNLRRSSPGLSYLVVPETHKDGAWHFHGLFANLSLDEVFFTGRYVVRRVDCAVGRTRFFRTRVKIYRIGRYKLGWMTATKVLHKERVTSYITKYITKEMFLNGLYGRKRYWCSRNLLVPQEEVYCLDDVDRFILSQELERDSSFTKYSVACYGELTQSVGIFEIQD